MPEARLAQGMARSIPWSGSKGLACPAPAAATLRLARLRRVPAAMARALPAVPPGSCASAPVKILPSDSLAPLRLKPWRALQIADRKRSNGFCSNNGPWMRLKTSRYSVPIASCAIELLSPRRPRRLGALHVIVHVPACRGGSSRCADLWWPGLSERRSTPVHPVILHTSHVASTGSVPATARDCHPFVWAHSAAAQPPPPCSAETELKPVNTCWPHYMKAYSFGPRDARPGACR